MTILIPKNASASDLEKYLKKIRKNKGKGFDATKHAGTVKWVQDPMDYQNEVRGE